MNDFWVVVIGTALGTVIGVAFTAAIGATLFWFKWPFHRLKHTYQRYQSERERKALEAEMQEPLNQPVVRKDGWFFHRGCLSEGDELADPQPEGKAYGDCPGCRGRLHEPRVQPQE